MLLIKWLRSDHPSGCVVFQAKQTTMDSQFAQISNLNQPRLNQSITSFTSQNGVVQLSFNNTTISITNCHCFTNRAEPNNVHNLTCCSNSKIIRLLHHQLLTVDSQQIKGFV